MSRIHFKALVQKCHDRIKSYTSRWSALDTGILTGWYIFQILYDYARHRTYVYKWAVPTRNEVSQNERNSETWSGKEIMLATARSLLRGLPGKKGPPRHSPSYLAKTVAPSYHIWWNAIDGTAWQKCPARRVSRDPLQRAHLYELSPAPTATRTFINQLICSQFYWRWYMYCLLICIDPHLNCTPRKFGKIQILKGYKMQKWRDRYTYRHRAQIPRRFLF